MLCGRTLEDKLAPVTDLTPVQVPPFPGRPPGLERPEGHRRLPTLRARDVRDPTGRQRILHELMNHELQAIELLAMALCRWPDAPAGLRKGFASTLADEQKHCRLYLERLRALGGEPGQVPVSTSFWDTLAPVEALDGFLAGLSLCYEAANLDFARTWRDRFRTAGDEATAEVLQTVLDDEIRHVSLGLAWFGEHARGDLIQAWMEALPAPLTPAHARGSAFNAEARRAAGFRPEQIRRLELLGGHRSRAPRVLAFDAGVEDRIAGRTPNASTRTIGDDLALVPLYLSRPEDVVVAPRPPLPFLEHLSRAGFVLPRFQPEAPVDTPWGSTPEHPGWDDGLAVLSDKCATLEHAQRLPAHPLLVDDLGSVWTDIRRPPDVRWVMKAPFSASGTQRIQGEGPLSEAQTRWLERQLRTHGRVVCMPWLEDTEDVSVHLTIGDEVAIDGLTRFATANGRFTGAWASPWIRTFGPEQRMLHGNGDRSMAVEPLLRTAAEAAGTWAQQIGYRGPLSIDALLVRTASGLRVHPWLETNARNTLGRVALAMQARIHPRSTAFWHVAPTPAPPTAFELEDGRLRSGVLQTTPPGQRLHTWLEITRNG